MIYLLTADEFPERTKIGFTERSPDERLKEQQTGSPVVLHICAAYWGDRRDDEALRNLFSQYRLHNEWFSIAPARIIDVFAHHARTGRWELIEPARRSKPWPKYDEIVGKNASKKIAWIANELLPWSEIWHTVGYEAQNDCRVDVLEALIQLAVRNAEWAR